MARNAKTAAACEIEIAEIERALDECRIRLETLTVKRNELRKVMRQLDIVAALEYIEESGLSADAVLKLLNEGIARKESTG